MGVFLEYEMNKKKYEIFNPTGFKISMAGVRFEVKPFGSKQVVELDEDEFKAVKNAFDKSTYPISIKEIEIESDSDKKSTESDVADIAENSEKVADKKAAKKKKAVKKGANK